MSAIITAKSAGGIVRDSLAEVDANGRFLRTASGYRDIISSTHPIFKPESGRYHLYVSMACPWANRCVALINMKGLQEAIGITVVHPTWQRTRPEDPNDQHCGWVFHDSENDPPLTNTLGHNSYNPSGCSPDHINHAKSIRDLYVLSGDTVGKYSVPILWDTNTKSIVNNESSDILRFLTVEFDAFASGIWRSHDFYPLSRRQEIDEVNAWIYPGINDGVYRCGFAKTQLAYNEAIESLSCALDRLELLLSRQRYLLSGRVLSEADVRLFMTLIRFDEVYVVYFKCNTKQIRDYHNIRNYCREMFQLPGMEASINMEHIKIHYFRCTCQYNINP